MQAIRADGGSSLADLAAALNARGITAPRGGKWRPAQVRRALQRNPPPLPVELRLSPVSGRDFP
ncbi:recombinase family protein [Bradyrhizobium sp. YCK136]|uniref:recombinase family protein n=1 Tax=Bradyrhizobium sp. YCK136 TaxID=3351346 RepID=UPI0037CBFDA3